MNTKLKTRSEPAVVKTAERPEKSVYALKKALGTGTLREFFRDSEQPPANLRYCEACDTHTEHVTCSTCQELECENCNKAYTCANKF